MCSSTTDSNLFIFLSLLYLRCSKKPFFSLGGEFIELRLFFFPEKLLGGNPISLCVEGVLFEEKGIFLVSGKDRFENICSTELSFNADENGAVKPSRCVWVPPQ